MIIDKLEPSVGAAASSITQSVFQISDIIIVFLLQFLFVIIGCYIFKKNKNKSTTEQDRSQ